MTTFWGWLGQAVVVGVGWYVVHRLSVARDRDKARREMVAKAADAIVENLTDLIAEARDYHLKPRDVTAELKIKIDLQDAAMRIAGFHDVCADKAPVSRCTSAIGYLRRSITAHHFEDEHSDPLPLSDSQLQEMAEAVLRAKQELLKLKHAQFPV